MDSGQSTSRHSLYDVVALTARDCTNKLRLNVFVFSEVLYDDISTHTEPDGYKPVIWILAHHLIHHQSVLFCPT